jgi:hypothetical protein
VTRSPDRDDKRLILKLAEQGVSVRRIAKLTTWSRPTISKVLAQEGFDPNTKRVATGSPEGGGGADHAPTLDFEEEMRQVDRETQNWWDGLSHETQDLIIRSGPEEDSGPGGFLDKNY